MDDIGSFIFILFGAVAAIVSAVQKNKKQNATAARPAVSAARPQQNAPAAPRQAAPAAKPASMVSRLPERPAAAPQPAQPRVHTHLAQDCETHDTSGSLQVVSPEGKDPCHEQQLPASREPLPETVTRPGLTLDWSSDAIVKAFVMQEVLTRPSDRRKH